MGKQLDCLCGSLRDLHGNVQLWKRYKIIVGLTQLITCTKSVEKLISIPTGFRNLPKNIIDPDNKWTLIQHPSSLICCRKIWKQMTRQDITIVGNWEWKTFLSSLFQHHESNFFQGYVNFISHYISPHFYLYSTL